VEESKEIYNLSPPDVHNLKMDPPENAWSLLEADLDKQAALMKGNTSRAFLFTLIGIALSVSAILTFFYLNPIKVSSLAMNNEKTEAPAITSSGIAGPSENLAASSTKEKSKAVNELSEKSKADKDFFLKEPETKIVAKEIKAKSTLILNKLPTHASQNSAAVKKNNKIFTVNGIIEEGRATPPGSTLDETTPAIIPPDKINSIETISSAPAPADNSANQPTAKDEYRKPDVKAKESVPVVAHNDSMINNLSTGKFSIAAFYSPDYTRNRLTNNPSAGADNIGEYYDGEKGKYAFSAGATVRYDLTGHWSIATGGIYSTLSYSSNVPVVYANYNTKNELSYRYPTSCGIINIPNANQAAVQKGDSLLLNTGCSQIVRFLTVPVTVRYQVNQNRFNFYSYTGVSANFMIGSRAKLNLNGTETTIINNVDGIKNMNYGYLLGAGVQYNFSNGVGIFIEPSYRGSINSLTENLSVNCYPYSLGLNTGLSLHF